MFHSLRRPCRHSSTVRNRSMRTRRPRFEFLENRLLMASICAEETRPSFQVSERAVLIPKTATASVEKKGSTSSWM